VASEHAALKDFPAAWCSVALSGDPGQDEGEADQSLLTSAATSLKLCFCWLGWRDKSVGVLEPRALEGRIRGLLGQPVSDEKLRERLEQLATDEISFSGFTWLWGPVLYKRNRILFLPFIVSKFSSYMTLPK